MLAVYMKLVNVLPTTANASNVIIFLVFTTVYGTAFVWASTLIYKKIDFHSYNINSVLVAPSNIFIVIADIKKEFYSLKVNITVKYINWTNFEAETKRIVCPVYYIRNIIGKNIKKMNDDDVINLLYVLGEKDNVYDFIRYNDKFTQLLRRIKLQNIFE